jgi:hypothetical protein
VALFYGRYGFVDLMEGIALSNELVQFEMAVLIEVNEFGDVDLEAGSAHFAAKNELVVADEIGGFDD